MGDKGNPLHKDALDASKPIQIEEPMMKASFSPLTDATPKKAASPVKPTSILKKTQLYVKSQGRKRYLPFHLSLF